MYKDKQVLYTVSLVTFAALFASLFVDLGSSKILAACLLIPLTVAVRLMIRKRCSHSPNKKEVFLLSTIIGVLYVVLVEMSGLFFGFYKNPYFVTPKLLLTTLLPLIVIIVTTEVIRSTLVDQNNTFALTIAFLICLVADVLAFSNIAGITSINRFMDLVGMTLFPAISANVFYHYTAKRFGMFPNIAFRLITTLYVYFIPSVTAMSDALLVCIKLFLPLVMLFLLLALYSKRKKNAVKKESKLGFVATALSITIMIAAAMLISCQFRFGAIVIATESMTGEINKGDMIIYEQYDDQVIEEGQVIVFLQDGIKIVHRVVAIERLGNETRYYTQGDANDTMDFGYRVDADIVGLTDMKVAYIGYPTLWLRELLEPVT